MQFHQPPIAAAKASKRRAIFWLGSALVVGTVPIAAWLARAPIAEVALSQFCKSRALSCKAKITKLSPSAVTLQTITITETNAIAAPFEASELEVGLVWRGWSPVPVSVALDKPVLRVGLVLDLSGGTKLDLRGLQRLLGPPSDNPPPQPKLDIRNAKIEVDTPAGPVVGSLALRGQWPQGVDAEVSFPATNLVRPEATLDLQAAFIEAKGLTPTGAAELDGKIGIERLKWGTWSLADTALSFGLKATDSKGQLGVQAQFGPIAVVQDGLTFKTRSGSANLSAEVPARLVDQALRAITSYQAALSIEDLVLFTASATEPGVSPLSLTARGLSIAGSGLIDSTSSEPVWRGPMLLEAKGLNISEYGALEQASYSAESVVGLAKARPDIRLDGTLKSGSISVAESKREALVQALPGIDRTAPFSAAMASAKVGISGALKAFDVSLPLRVSRSAEGEIIVGVSGNVRLDARNGLILNAKPVQGGPTLAYRQGRTSGNARLDLSGAGLPTANLTGRYSASAAELSFKGSASLSSTATADDRLQLVGQEIDVKRDTTGLMAAALLELDADTTVFGAQVKGVKVSGQVALRQSTDELAVDFGDDACLVLSAQSIRRADWLVRDTSARMCVLDGPVYLRTKAGQTIQAKLNNLRVSAELATAGMLATLAKGEARLKWAEAGGVFDIAAVTPQINIGLVGGPFSVQADGLTLTGRRSTGYELSLQKASAAGLGLPVRLNNASLTIPVLLRPKIEFGEGSLSGVISDAPKPLPGAEAGASAPLPRFEPVKLAGAIKVSDGKLEVEGQPSLVRSSMQLGRLTVVHDLKDNIGNLELQGDMLTFARGGLQPTSITGLLRGVFTNAVGRFKPSVRIGWTKGALTSSGNVIFEGLGFSTEKAGRIDGVNGTITLTDLFDLKSPPDQTLLIDRIDPGLPFFGGVLKFQLLGGGKISIERASFPFAGGELQVAPTVWQPGGEHERLVIEAIRLQGPEIASLVNAGKLRLTGVLSGTIPAVLTRTGVKIENAWLEADQSGGVLKFEHEGTEAAGQADPGAKLAFDALRDLRYSIMRLGLDGDLAGEMSLTFVIEGQNPAIYGGQPIRMNMTIAAPLMALVNQASLATSGAVAVDRVRRLVSENANTRRSGGVADTPVQSRQEDENDRTRP